MKKIMFLFVVLSLLAGTISACGSGANVGDTVTALAGAGELNYTLNEPWAQTTICTPFEGERFIITDISTYGYKEDISEVWDLQSLDRPGSSGCWGWTGPGDLDHYRQ